MALAILAPVLIFIATATRLSAARREERFAAMRLAGATRRQVSLLAATESTVAAALGMAAGFGIFFLLRIPVAGIPFVGEQFFPAELSLSPRDVLEVAIGVPVFAAVAIGTGFAGAAMFATEAQQHPMVAPGAAYYLLTAVISSLN